jgi:hypothetical protein
MSSRPSTTYFKIMDETNQIIVQRITPQIVSLKSGKAYFEKKKDIVPCAKEGFYPNSTPVNSRCNPLYIANVFCFPFIGMMVVDHFNWPIYKVEENKISIVLSPVQKQMGNNNTLNTNGKFGNKK